MKVIIEYKNRFVESFTKKSVCLTSDINRAGKYSEAEAKRQIEVKKMIDAKYISIHN